jgi:hypothetical protein
MKKPEIIKVIKEMELVGSRFDIMSCTYGKIKDSETYTCPVDREYEAIMKQREDLQVEMSAKELPGIPPSELLVFTEGVCSTTGVDIKSPVKNLEVRFFLPDTMEFADEVKVLLRRPKRK